MATALMELAPRMASHNQPTGTTALVMVMVSLPGWPVIGSWPPTLCCHAYLFNYPHTERTETELDNAFIAHRTAPPLCRGVGGSNGRLVPRGGGNRTFDLC